MDVDDKTRIIIGRRKAGADTQEPNDRTRVASRASDVTRVQLRRPSALPNERNPSADTHGTPADKTRVKPVVRDVVEEAGSELSSLIKAAEEGDSYGTLKGRFVFEEILGAGGMGIVYKAKDLLKVEAQDREPYVAIKVLSEEFKAHPEAFIALQRESRKTQRMAHPNIVNVHDFDRDGDTVFMTMEYMEGTPLDRLISQYRSIGLPRETVWQILEDISAALIYAHEQHVIHSDFKPGNVFVTTSGTAKIFDFGIARAVAKAENLEESIDDRTVFDAGTLGALTPAYASLEMLEGETPDIRDDIYALGCIAYELFTGEHPYNRMHADEAQRQNIKAKRIPGITKKQWRAIERAIAFKRVDRSSSVEEFWRDLTVKQSQIVKIRIAAALVICAVGAAYYQFKPEPPPGLSEDQFRSEIERNLRIEMKKDSVTNLMETRDFSSGWERELWGDVQELRQLLGRHDPWVVETESHIFQSYLEVVNERVDATQLDAAESLMEHAQRYGDDTAAMDNISKKIAAARLAIDRDKAEQRQRELARAEERRRAAEQAEVAAKQNSQFDQALANLRRQLQCHSNINMNDFAIALGQLKTISTQRYSAEEAGIARSLAACIENIGASFPERAEAAKRDAIGLFTRNATIAAINIRPRDPCRLSLAGTGAQSRGATCQDRISGVQHTPVMVVIPGANNIKPFAIGQTEVTVEQINEFCRLSKSCDALAAADHSLPAHQFSIGTANAYLKWLSDQSGYRYRLPSKIEWQHAANADGSRVDSNRNCRLNSRGISKGNALVRVSVGQKNKWGLINHLGNAQEWVSDRGGRLLAVGGSYETSMEQCNADFTTPHGGDPDATTGLRVLRELAGQS